MKKKKKQNIIGIIPARMGSSRFPGKPLADILGFPMIYHVYARSALSSSLNAVYVATCDKEIETCCKKYRLNVVMTKHTHERASDRTAEAMLKVEKNMGRKVDVAVMVQGDEPLVYPEMIDLAVKPLKRAKDFYVVNLSAPLKAKRECEDPNEVKVVVDKKGFAMYFSREPIPSLKKGAKRVVMMKQICVIPFKRDFLITFNRLSQTPLEKIESVDMLRCLEHGYKVKIIPCQFDTYSVDTKEDLRKVRALMKKDKLFLEFKHSMRLVR